MLVQVKLAFKLLLTVQSVTVIGDSFPRPANQRILSAVGSVESLIPLHSVIADARLTSNVVSVSTSWSWLSQGTSCV
ncbi:hypothetical protein KIW84_075192 [Lathyrus oleraceus]|uniref:Secreted protein n=1 Tax=Pisum sativum TaxID=3888 RepID=A0A9D4VUQ2_PEA|nr:hypothetical protein KIW84_075192 [Pisum sativum]